MSSATQMAPALRPAQVYSEASRPGSVSRQQSVSSTTFTATATCDVPVAGGVQDSTTIPGSAPTAAKSKPSPAAGRRPPHKRLRRPRRRRTPGRPSPTPGQLCPGATSVAQQRQTSAEPTSARRPSDTGKQISRPSVGASDTGRHHAAGVCGFSDAKTGAGGHRRRIVRRRRYGGAGGAARRGIDAYAGRRIRVDRQRRQRVVH